MPVPGRSGDDDRGAQGANGYQSLHTTLFGAKVNIEGDPHG